MKRWFFCGIVFFTFLLITSARVFSQQISSKNDNWLNWDFPIERCHAGIPMGNGRQGLLIWGQDSVLKITIAHAGFWDRRGALQLDSNLTYRKIKKLLEQKNEPKLREVFGYYLNREPKSNLRPRQLGGALLELPLPKGFLLKSANLNFKTGWCEIIIASRKISKKITIRQHAETNMAVISWSEIPNVPVLKGVGDILSGEYKSLGIQMPSYWNQSPGCKGVKQNLPEDEALGIAFQNSGHETRILSGIGNASSQTVLMKELQTFNPQTAEHQTINYWTAFWKKSPVLKVPDDELMEMFHYGLYKMAICSHPNGPAMTLQGPMMEHYQLPPWSNDYHFNINVQMMYWPVMSYGHFERMAPFWKMIETWLPKMKANGSHFFENEEALYLPHATDDKGNIIGGFWSGTIDLGCLAWLSQLAWKQYQHSGDSIFLKKIAFPLLKGAFGGYLSELEKSKDSSGESSYKLPVSVSPEFKGAQMDAWGSNASFQLSAIHMLIQLLKKASIDLSIKYESVLDSVERSLPPYTLVYTSKTLEYPQYKAFKIGVWDGMDLIESHRHHSHMASLYPFVTINPFDSVHAPIVENTFYNWSRKGTGSWTGWCVPWASILLSRINQPESAISMLKWGKMNFTNKGRGTLHDVAHPWIATSFSKQKFGKKPAEHQTIQKEKMQLDAGFGNLEALAELLFQSRIDGLYVLPEVPQSWKNFSFDGFHAEGGYVIGASIQNHKVQEIRILTKRKGPIRLVHGLGNSFLLNGKKIQGEILEGVFPASTTLILKPDL